MISFTKEIDKNTIERMKRDGVVVLSPHFDDACFSIGALLRRIETGVLVNIFNRSNYLPNPPKDTTPPLREETVAEVRGREDRTFAALCGLHRRQLGFSEPGFQDRKNDDLSTVDLDVTMAESVVLETLKACVGNTSRKPYLLAPMAIGTHVNHHAVYQIVRRNAAELATRFHLCFYEDLPYARNPAARSKAVKRFQTEWKNNSYKRNVLTVGWPEKRCLVEIYASQFRRPPGALKFRPAACWPLQVHEAIWLNEPELA